MNPVRTPGPVVAFFLASASVAFAQNAGRTYSDLPGMGKPVRSGYVVTTEGGVEGTQTVYYDEGESRKGPGRKVDPKDRRGMGPVATAERPGVVESGGRIRNSDKPVDMMDYRDDPAVAGLAGREENLSERRFGRDASSRFSKDERFDDKGRPDFGRWGREGERRDKERSEYVGMGDKYDTSARPVFGRWGRDGERREREDYAGGKDRAEVMNWDELFSRDKSAKYSGRDTTSPLGQDVKGALDRIRAYEQASMQSINRTAFRRSHSDNSGELPVAPVGKGTDGVKPMRPGK